MKLLGASLVAITLIAVSTEAQTKRSKHRSKPKTVVRPQSTGPSSNIVESTKVATQPVVVVNAPEPDFLSGEANVKVSPNQPTVVRLGLAQNAVAIVEFPASDGIYYIHEGNPKLASVFQSPTKETDRSITIYPGEGFVSSKDGGTSAAISVQMRSGLVLIFELVPVSDLRKNAHRCVISYDRETVVSARKIAGLAFDLGGDSPTVSPINSRAASKLIGSIQTPDSRNSIPSNPEVNLVSNAVYAELPERKQGNPKRIMTDAEISKASNKRLADVLRDQKKHLGTWSSPLHGLELSLTRISDLDAEHRLVVVAVRNSTTSNLRLLQGSPELQVQTLDKDGNNLLTSKLDIRYLETTALEGLVLPGSTTFYALVYKSPILGTNQKIRVVVAQTEAADTPVTAAVNGSK